MPTFTVALMGPPFFGTPDMWLGEQYEDEDMDRSYDRRPKVDVEASEGESLAVVIDRGAGALGIHQIQQFSLKRRCLPPLAGLPSSMRPPTRWLIGGTGARPVAAGSSNPGTNWGAHREALAGSYGPNCRQHQMRGFSMEIRCGRTFTPDFLRATFSILTGFHRQSTLSRRRLRSRIDMFQRRGRLRTMR